MNLALFTFVTLLLVTDDVYLQASDAQGNMDTPPGYQIYSGENEIVELQVM